LKTQQTKLSFFKNLPILQHWTVSQVQKVLYSFSEKPFTRNQTVYQQGEDANIIYLVKEGEFEMLQKINNKFSELSDA